MTRILCLWLPNWPIQQLLRSRPELRNRPVALVASGPRGGQVVACSSTAAAGGIHTGMPVVEAQALVRELAVAPHEPLADRRELEKLAEGCEQFTPFIALEEGDEPESLLLDISNLEHLWDGEDELLAQVETWFKRRGYQVRLAIAETIGFAWAVAHFGDGERQTANDEIRMTNDRTTHSSFVIRHSSLTHCHLPVEALRIANDTAALLHQLGIQTVGQLQALPREDLSSRFGEELLRRLDQFTGAVQEVLRPHRGVAALQAAGAFDEPTADRAMVMHMLSRLVERLTRQLAARDEGAVLLVCTLHSRTCRAVSLRIGLLEPSANARQLLELVELHLETVRLAEEVDRVEIRAAVTGRLGERQRDLFADRWPSDLHQLALLVNRLSSRLGYEQVLRAELRASAAPERAVRYAPMTQRRDRETRRQGDKGKSRRSFSPCLPLSLSPCLFSPRPLLLQPEPQSLEVVCVAPDGPPQFVWLEGRRERIVHCAGPERIESLWWRGPSVRRDYYRVATQSGSHLWIFRRRSDARWFLHGFFD